MGMPSASIAVQELMRMVHFLKRGDLDAMAEVFWARVGTSGGVGLPAGPSSLRPRVSWPTYAPTGS